MNSVQLWFVVSCVSTQYSFPDLRLYIVLFNFELPGLGLALGSFLRLLVLASVSNIVVK